jgi:peptidoglycan/xylan/chitin deacetylase (PgdA/CDA1 family)
MKSLRVVMYHYVRDLPHTRFPRIKGMLLDDFRAQIRRLQEDFEMANLETALAFLRGQFNPSRNLCLLTFDDGLKEHCREVTEVLSHAGIQGIFFVVTACPEEGRVMPVHMNHFLMASLEFQSYKKQLLDLLSAKIPEPQMNTHAGHAAKTYPWDTPEIAEFKYLLNFLLDPSVRDDAIRELFEANLGDQHEFARKLYFSWEEGREMQAAGMVLGGHTHTHQPIASLERSAMKADLGLCRRLLDQRLLPQQQWPFSYPYGKADSYDDEAVQELKALGFDCSFSTEPGDNAPLIDPFRIRRVDCKQGPGSVATGGAHLGKTE